MLDILFRFKKRRNEKDGYTQDIPVKNPPIGRLFNDFILLNIDGICVYQLRIRDVSVMVMLL